MYNDNEQPYVPQVGDTVRRPLWAPSTDPVEVTATGRRRFLGLDSSGEYPYDIDGGWVKVVKPLPLPERWINTYANGRACAHFTRQEANHASMRERIAVLHIWTDADGNDHAEIERVER